MECQEYIERYLSADADDELGAADRQRVELHLTACHECRGRLTEELALKASLQRYCGIVKTPADVRLRLRAALGEHAQRGVGSRRGLGVRAFSALRLTGKSAPGDLAVRPETADKQDDSAGHLGLGKQLRRVQYLAPAALVAIALTISVAVVKGNFTDPVAPAAPTAVRSVPAFDFAIASYNKLSQAFDPNVPAEAFSRDNDAYFAWVEENDPVRHVSDALPDISSSYEKIHMPREFCDFALAGYQLIGGRVDRLSSGAPVTYTLYRTGNNDSILSIGLHQPMGAPEGGYWFGTHAFYSYQGYSLCLTVFPTGHLVSIIVTRNPIDELLRDVAASDVSFLDQ